MILCQPISGTLNICNTCSELILDDVRLYTPQYLPTNLSICEVVINGIKENEINVYPNPITEKLTINTNIYELTEVILYDLSSRKLLEQTFTKTTTIDTEQLPNGMYLYEVRKKNGIIKNGKVIKL